MDGSILIVAAFLCCAFGFLLNSMYAKKYGVPAIQWKLFALQFICIGGALMQLPGDEMSSEFICILYKPKKIWYTENGNGVFQWNTSTK